MNKMLTKALENAEKLEKSIKDRERRHVSDSKLQADKYKLSLLVEEANKWRNMRCVNWLQRNTQLNICALTRKIKALKIKFPQ